MKSNSAQNVFFDDEATRIMGTAFDRACKAIPNFSGTERMRILFAKRILESAGRGERDPHRLHLQALNGFPIKRVAAPTVGVLRPVPTPAYAPVPVTA